MQHLGLILNQLSTLKNFSCGCIIFFLVNEALNGILNRLVFPLENNFCKFRATGMLLFTGNKNQSQNIASEKILICIESLGTVHYPFLMLKGILLFTLVPLELFSVFFFFFFFLLQGLPCNPILACAFCRSSVILLTCQSLQGDPWL